MSSNSNSLNSAARGSRETIAGYFADGNDAHRAINELRDEGFAASEIGAAFHSGTMLEPSARGMAQVSEDTKIRSIAKPGSTIAGPASDTSAVTPSGLSTGSGTPMAGASRPGPIPGSEIPTDLPTDIPSDLVANAREHAFSRPGAVDVNSPTSGDFHEMREPENQSWWSKLKQIFGSQEVDPSLRREPVSDKSSLNYGTGEGHLGVHSDYEYAYSGSAFEQSFSGMGIPQVHAERLSRELLRGGAVVTVRAGSKNIAAESILERNHGIIRYESASDRADDLENANPEARVEIFGEVHRVYPGYITKKEVRGQKAS